MPDAERDTGKVIEDGELDSLFASFLPYDRIVLAVSGGPDSTAMLLLARAWRYGLLDGPSFVVVTVDHRLRPESAGEAQAVANLCFRLGLKHVVLPWVGPKPATGVQEAARDARYALLHDFARENRVGALALAHTQDDQAETVLFRIARGSGIGGLGAMRPVSSKNGIAVLRPLLGTTKARLVATLEASDTPFVRDPSNEDVRFTRPRLRVLAPILEREGLDSARFAALARRAARADRALEAAADAAQAAVSLGAWQADDDIRLDIAAFLALPEEVGLRVLMRAVAARATPGRPVGLSKAERLYEEVVEAACAGERLRRTLAGAMVTLGQAYACIAFAPPRRTAAGRLAANSAAEGALVLGKGGVDP